MISFIHRIKPGAFRLLLAFIVVVFHTVSFLTIGHLAVYIFFVLSGFWITNMYVEKYSKYNNPYVVYLKSRILRVYPLYITIFVFTLLVVYFMNSYNSKYDFSFINLLQNFMIISLALSDKVLLTPAWSLDIELQFYFIAPVLLFLAKQKFGELILIVLSILSLLYFFSPESISFIIKYILFFIVGFSLYYYKIVFLEKMSSICLFIAFISLLVNYTFPYLRINYLLNKDATLLHCNYQELLNGILLILFIPFISINVNKKVNDKLDQLMSSMSYSLYLVHWPILLLYAKVVKNINGLEKAFILVIYYAICILISFLISNTIDKYFERIRKGILLKRGYRLQNQNAIL